MKLIDYFRLKADKDKNCPHCVIGQNSDGLGVFWCNAKDKDGDPRLGGPYYIPFETAELCILKDWGGCPLNPNNIKESGGS